MKYKQYEVTLKKFAFRNGGAAYFLIASGESIARVNSWVPGLDSDEIAVKDYSENEGMLDFLIAENLILPPHRYITSGYVQMPVVRLK